MKAKRESAVSPVVGVMLLIVVTVIIAGVVALVSSGFIEQTPKSAMEPEIDFVGLYTIGYSMPGGMQSIPKKFNQSEAGGLLFKVKGSTPVDLTKLKLDLSSYTGGGGFVSLTSNDPVSTAYLPGSSNWKNRNGMILPPEFMRGHRVVMYGVNANDENLEEKLNVTVAEPGDMFIFVPEYIGNSLSLAIGLRKDDEHGTAIQSGAMSADGGTFITLSNTDTGAQYVYHVLQAQDIITRV